MSQTLRRMVLHLPEGYGVLLNQEHTLIVTRHSPLIAEQFPTTDQGELILTRLTVLALLDSDHLTLTLETIRPLVFAFRQQFAQQRLSSVLGLLLPDYQAVKYGETEVSVEAVTDVPDALHSQLEAELDIALAMRVLYATFDQVLDQLIAREQSMKALRYYRTLKKKLFKLKHKAPNDREIKAAQKLRDLE